jgi:hypothetical protein
MTLDYQAVGPRPTKPATALVESDKLSIKAKPAYALKQSSGGRSRGERIRTSDLYVPNVAHYRAVLHPEKTKLIIRKKCTGLRLGNNFFKLNNISNHNQVI